MIRLTNAADNVPDRNHYVGTEADWPSGLWFGTLRGFQKQLVYRTIPGYIIWLGQERQSESAISVSSKELVDVRRVNVSGTLEYL